MSLSAARVRVRFVKLPVVLLVLFTVFQLVGHSHWQLVNDSYRYARSTLQMLGEPRAQAQEHALEAYCSSRAHRSHADEMVGQYTWLNPEPQSRFYRDCMNGAKATGGLEPNQPQYERIFDTRPGYPLLLAPAVGLLGVVNGMWLMSLVFTLLCAALIYRILREVGLSVVAGGVGMAAFLVSPLAGDTGSMGALTEGPVLATILGAMLGGLWLVRGRTRAGAGVLALSYLVMALVKYSTAMMLGGAFAAVGVLLVLTCRRLPRGRLWVFTAVSAVTVLAVTVASHLWNLPGTDATLQDTFAYHFTRPDVPHPTTLLSRLDVRYWKYWLVLEGFNSYYLPLLAAAGYALARNLRRLPMLVWLCVGVWLVGIAGAVAHPVVDQGVRLWLPAWLPVVFGLGLGLEDLLRRHGHPSAPSTAGARPSELPGPTREAVR